MAKPALGFHANKMINVCRIRVLSERLQTRGEHSSDQKPERVCPSKRQRKRYGSREIAEQPLYWVCFSNQACLRSKSLNSHDGNIIKERKPYFSWIVDRFFSFFLFLKMHLKTRISNVVPASSLCTWQQWPSPGQAIARNLQLPSRSLGACRDLRIQAVIHVSRCAGMELEWRWNNQVLPATTWTVWAANGGSTH